MICLSEMLVFLEIVVLEPNVVIKTMMNLMTDEE